MLNCLILVRKIHSGHIKRVLNSKKAPFHKKFDKIFADQRENPKFSLINVKYEKDKLLKELTLVKNDLVGLFSLEEASKMLDAKQESKYSEITSMNEARRIYRILRPEAPSFFEEQASNYLKTTMNELLSPETMDSNEKMTKNDADVVRDENPVFTSNCYTLAVISLLESLTEDVYSFCEYLEIENLPDRSYDSLSKLFERLKDGSDLDKWINRVWPKFQNYFVDDLKQITNEEITGWLKSHLKRVSNNLNILNKPNGEWYNFSEDILYDSISFSEKVNIENKIEFPIEKAPLYLNLLFSLFQDVNVENNEELIKSLKGLGLSKWFKLLPNEIETKLFGVQKPCDKFEFNEEDYNLSYLLVETMSRNLDHLLDIQTYSPNLMLSNISKNLRSNLFQNPENKWMSGDKIKEMINKVYNKKTDLNDLKELVNTPLKQMLIDEYNYTKKIGSMVLNEYSDKDDNTTRSHSKLDSKENKYNNKEEKDEEKNKWKWVIPSVDSIFDTNRNIYIRNKSNLDPTIRLDNLKSFILSRKRMRSMTKEGRVYFVRVVVAIGDGNGYFGIGIGHGNDVTSAKNSGIENGLKNMFFLDYDAFESLTTPVLGREYGSRCLIQPRPMGSGISCNIKFLPLVYLTGLDNVRFKLKGTSSWVTRIRSIRKALESIMSRKTIANMLGKKYVEVSSPGDYTIHWSDEWFNPILNEYKEKINKLKSLRFRFSRKNRYKYNILLPSDISEYVPKYNKSVMDNKLDNKLIVQERLNEIKWTKLFQ